MPIAPSRRLKVALLSPSPFGRATLRGMEGAGLGLDVRRLLACKLGDRVSPGPGVRWGGIHAQEGAGFFAAAGV